MDKAPALHSFWSSFGIPAIDEQSAYDNPTAEELLLLPMYITYESAIGSFDGFVAIGADLWHRSASWAAISQKADEIMNAIGLGGKLVPYDNGAIWITQADPVIQRLPADTNYEIRRIHININAEYLSV